MPKVTIDGRTVEVDAGTNLIEAGLKAGVQIPHYCYHPRLSVVGQCRMCLVKIEGMPTLQAGCTTRVMKDGMTVQVDEPEVKAAQEGIMEFLLINHPLDCPICDQAGECGLQDYSFKHGQAFSRFAYEEKRTYPGKERIPLGPSVVLNMNRCIQCTRCIRFTEEVSGTAELGFFQRGSRAEIGVFPGKELDNPLSTCVVDICPVGALTSTRFRFAERVWYLDKSPSLCTGCDVGCNITVEHRRGRIRRYKPRFNAEVNDYWMCDYGRSTSERYTAAARLTSPQKRDNGGALVPCSWAEALSEANQRLDRGRGDQAAFLAAGTITTEEAFLLTQLADALSIPNRGVLRELGPKRQIPNPGGGIGGDEKTPNRRGALLAGLRPEAGGLAPEDLVEGEAAARCEVLLVADADENAGSRLHQTEVVERLREATTLIVMGWAETPLSRAADIVLPIAAHTEKEGTFVNVDFRLQKFQRAFPPLTGIRSGLEVLIDLLRLFSPSWREVPAERVFTHMAKAVPALTGLTFASLPVEGVQLKIGEGGQPARSD
jgi:NADH-quinone oxidoreductase subunit G